jgi:hypothetical protein
VSVKGGKGEVNFTFKAAAAQATPDGNAAQLASSKTAATPCCAAPAVATAVAATAK